MLIISKNKDYYDGVVGTTGVDKTIVFERTTETNDNRDKFPKPFRRSSGWKNKTKLAEHFSFKRIGDKYLDANHFIIGFCGKLYLGFRMEYENPEQRFLNDRLFDFTYDVNEIKTHFKPYWCDEFVEFVEYVKNYDCTHIHRELNTPIFVYDVRPDLRRDYFIVNPMLNVYQFYKVFDAFTTFQEIQIYISGVLGVGENPTIEVSDKDKIISRGFDYKCSFRKEPKEKK